MSKETATLIVYENAKNTAKIRCFFGQSARVKKEGPKTQGLPISLRDAIH